MKVMCIDLKSFYASVECVLRGIDPFSSDLVVADKERGPGSIVLAVSPHLKQYGVKSRCRIFDLPKNIDIIYAKPRMRKYIEYACKIYNVYLTYLDREDIHIYSIDEAFLDITTYLNYYNMPVTEIGKQILDDIYRTTGVTGSCGIGDNMFLAKVALDVLAKNQSTHIAYLSQELFYKHIWDLRPISEIWGIGYGVEKRLAKMGIFTMRELAQTPLPKLEKEFGILGRELLEHAFGIEHTTVKEARNYCPDSKSFGHGQMLYQDYTYRDLEVILREMVDEVATELVSRKLCCQLIALGIGYSKAVGGGFSRQMTLDTKTNSQKKLMEAFLALYYKHVQDYPIRRIDVRVGKLSLEEFMQPDLFEGPDAAKKEHDLYEAIGKIKDKYGKNAVHLAVSNTEKSTFIKRNTLIGGHNAE